MPDVVGITARLERRLLGGRGVDALDAAVHRIRPEFGVVAVRGEPGAVAQATLVAPASLVPVQRTMGSTYVVGCPRVGQTVPGRHESRDENDQTRSVWRDKPNQAAACRTRFHEVTSRL